MSFSGSDFFLALKEKRFARRKVRDLLHACSAVKEEHPDLAGPELYKAILLRTEQVDPMRIDEILAQAENSVDEWTAPGRTTMGFREVAHFFVTAQYIDGGRPGAVVSFRDIVDELIPADL